MGRSLGAGHRRTARRIHEHGRLGRTRLIELRLQAAADLLPSQAVQRPGFANTVQYNPLRPGRRKHVAEIIARALEPVDRAERRDKIATGGRIHHLCGRTQRPIRKDRNGNNPLGVR